jgi:hypothetical protein
MPAGMGKPGRYYVVLENVGGATVEGEVTVRDKLPSGVTAGFGGQVPYVEVGGGNGVGSGETRSCEIEGAGEVVCHFSQSVVSSGFVVVHALVTASVAAGDVLTNVVSVTGGNAAPVTKETSTRVGIEGEPGPAGINEFGFEVTGPAGEPAQRAAGHPTLVTTTALFNNLLVQRPSEPLQPVEPVKDLVFYLPLGFLGDPQAPVRCPASLVNANSEGFGVGECPPGSRVGTVLPMSLSNVFADSFDSTGEFPIYNVAPEKGYAAEFVFEDVNFLFYEYANVVRRDGTYMLRVAVPGVPTNTGLTGLISTFYGDSREPYSAGGQELSRDLGAFLTNPSACSSAPLDASLELNTFAHPDTPITRSATAYSAIEGCEQLRFSSSLSAQPATTQADAPSSYTVDLEVPQAPEGFLSLGTPPLKNVTVTLPAGASLSPGAANGLSACQETGADGIDIEGAESEAVAADGLPRPVAGHCPSSSQVGTVRATSPLLGEELQGHMFLATPKCGAQGQPGCTPQDAQNGNLFGLYIELEAPGAGVIIKLAGKASVDPATGRITTIFEDAPQFPVSNLVVETNGGPRAPLANPQSCGTVSSTSDLTPWSTPVTPDSISSSSFNVNWDGENGGCPADMPFSPSSTAGTVTPLAGTYSPFTLTLKREDREQDVNSISTTLPEGLLAAVSHVTQCPEPQASQGACPETSRVGTSTVGIGSGSEPFYQTGQVYFTGPYAGAPFGLSVVVPAVAGPFNLGNVIVRVALSINPTTAQVTATSSAFPQIIDGVPLRIRTVNVTLNNAAFTFNPTNCSALSITGTIHSTAGANASVSSPFAAAGCKNLPFKPGFTASTAGRASKAGGASLVVKVTSKGGPQTGGGEANIRSVKVDLPKQLPSRLTTLQKACTEAQFNTNPAGCPAASAVGIATAATPILAHPLVGPAYLVSHGGAAFPDLEIILQGEGVTLVLDGNTSIKKGITSSTFKTVPDAPISSFELKLPTGKFSVLGANVPAKDNYNLCGQTLSMPTAITAQSGAVVKQSTKIAVTGCGKVKKKALTRAQKLKAALKACRKQAKGKLAGCEKQARKRYRPVKTKKKK